MKNKDELHYEGHLSGCLVLRRKPGEGIRVTLGDIPIEVVVVKIRGNSVRLAIQAPKEYGIIDRITYSKMGDKEDPETSP